MPTVGDLLSNKAPVTPSAAGAQMPDGFVAADDTPPPPPKGFVLETSAAPPRTVGDMFGMDVRGIMTGAGKLADIVGSPMSLAVNSAVDAAGLHKVLGHMSAQPVTAGAEQAADAMGLAKPVTKSEKLINSLVEGGTQGLAAGGVARLATAAPGAAGLVARALAASPVTDAAASAVGAGAQEYAAQHGAGPLGQLAAGLAGGVAGVAGARRVADIMSGIAERYGAKAAKIATEVPASVALDDKGELTAEGQEIAARNNLHPDQVKGAYADAEAAVAAEKPRVRVQAGSQPAAEPAETAPAAEGVAPAAEPAPAVQRPSSAAGEATAAQARPAEAPIPEGAANQPLNPGDKAVVQTATGPHPVEIVGPARPVEGGTVTPVISQVHGGMQFVPTEQLAAAPVAEAAPVAAAPEAAPAESIQASPGSVSGPAQARLAEAQSEDVNLSKGQATRNFDTYAKEQQLRGTQSPEAEQARQFFANQQQQIQNALERFQTAVAPNAPQGALERGQLVKDALTDLRDAGKAGVSKLYEQARQLAEAVGGEGSNLIRLDTQPLLSKMRELWADEGIPDQVRNSLKQQAAKFGLIGQSPQTIEGETTVSLTDHTGQPAGKIKFVGSPEPLTVVNAEGLRQKLNSLFDQYRTPEVLRLKPVLDDAVQSAVERAATEGKGDVGKAFKAARAAHQEQQQTFAAKDVVQKLIDWKVRGVTPTVLPENAIKTILQGDKESMTQLKKVKAVLLSKPTEQSKAAWQAIQAHAVASIFDKAMVQNSAPAGEVMATVSGAKLNTAVAKFGTERLKTLLPESDFNQLMKLKRIVGNATIPIDNTVNTSGSGWAVIRFLAGQGMKLSGSALRAIPVVGHLADAARGLYGVGKQAAEAKATLQGVQGFTAEQAAKADAPKPNPAEYARDFVRIAGSDQILAPLTAVAANENVR